MPGSPSRVALVTCLELPEPDPDQDLMLRLLNDAGLEPALVAWDDADADWTAYDLAVLRSCWNYHETPDAFVAWCRRVDAATRLHNSAPVVEWNLHKRYLKELEDAGLPIVPTAFIGREESIRMPDLLRERGWSDIVVKPCISAGSARTRRFRDACGEDQDSALAFSESLVADTDIMIQPFIPSVETGGERAAIWIGGETTHAIVKQPRFHDDIEQVSDAQAVSSAEHDLLKRCLAVVQGEPLYARLDTMRHADGSLLISELELIEPSLFLLQSKGAQACFVEAVRRVSSNAVD